MGIRAEFSRGVQWRGGHNVHQPSGEGVARAVSPVAASEGVAADAALLPAQGDFWADRLQVDFPGDAPARLEQLRRSARAKRSGEAKEEQHGDGGRAAEALASLGPPFTLHKRLKLAQLTAHCDDTRFQPGTFALDRVENVTPSLIVNLYPNGWSINNQSTAHPYSQQNMDLLRALDAGRIPSELLDEASCSYSEGCLVCEIRDYRVPRVDPALLAAATQQSEPMETDVEPSSNTPDDVPPPISAPAAAGSSAAAAATVRVADAMELPTKPRVRRILHKPSDAVINYVDGLTDRYGAPLTAEQKLTVEEGIVNVTNARLCLDPSPTVAYVANAAQFHRGKMLRPYRAPVVDIVPPAEIAGGPMGIGMATDMPGATLHRLPSECRQLWSFLSDIGFDDVAAAAPKPDVPVVLVQTAMVNLPCAAPSITRAAKGQPGEGAVVHRFLRLMRGDRAVIDVEIYRNDAASALRRFETLVRYTDGTMPLDGAPGLAVGTVPHTTLYFPMASAVGIDKFASEFISICEKRDIALVADGKVLPWGAKGK